MSVSRLVSSALQLLNSRSSSPAALNDPLNAVNERLRATCEDFGGRIRCWYVTVGATSVQSKLCPSRPASAKEGQILGSHFKVNPSQGS